MDQWLHASWSVNEITCRVDMEPKWKFRIDVQMTSTRWSPECLVKFSTYNIDLVNIGKWGCYEDRGNMVAKNNMNLKKQTKLQKKELWKNAYYAGESSNMEFGSCFLDQW